MARIRNDTWKTDKHLETCLNEYVRKGLQQVEILDYMERDFMQYTWSLRTLQRRLQHFGIKRVDEGIAVDAVKAAIREELRGPGQLLGNRAMHQKVKQVHMLPVPRDLVYDVMFDVDPKGLQDRAFGKRKRAKGHFHSPGVNWVHSLDGHDKLMGYQNSTFPIAIYGCMDAASRKILWLKVFSSNSDPDVVGKWYIEYIFKSKVIASKLRLDKGSERGKIATIHAFLRKDNMDMESKDCDKVCDETVIYGPSTANQVCDYVCMNIDIFWNANSAQRFVKPTHSSWQPLHLFM